MCIYFSALELFAWRKLTKDKQNEYIEYIPIYDERTQDKLKTAVIKAGNQLAVDGIERMEVEIKRAIKFLQISNDLRR